MTNEMQLAGAGGNIEEAVENHRLLKKYIAQDMKLDQDFGVIPGTKKRTLYQPGAQKLLFFNGLGVRFEIDKDQTIVDHDKPMFVYAAKATIFHKRTGQAVGESIGIASSKESRYAWQWVPENKLPRDLRDRKDELESREGKYGELYRIPNPELPGMANTILKMAQKRALVTATIHATRASADFIPEDDAEQEASSGGERPRSSSSSKPAAAKGVKPGCINEKQQKLVYARMKAAGWDPEDFREWLENEHPETKGEDGRAHTANIPYGKMEPILKAIEDYKERIEEGAKSFG